MNCRVCNALLPQGAAVCPQCGTRINAYGFPAGQPQQQSPQVATNYGSDPYNVLQPPPPPPYYPNVPPTTPPVQPKKKKRSLWLYIGIPLIVIMAICGLGAYGLTKLVQYGTDISIHETATAQANQLTPTPGSSQTPTPTNTNAFTQALPAGATLLTHDTMENTTSGNLWSNSSTTSKTNANDTYACGYKDGSYHITRTIKGSLSCRADATNLTLSNLAIAAKLSVVKGERMGILVRLSPVPGKGYLFFTDIEGNYNLDLINYASTTNNFTVLTTGQSAAIHTGLNTENELGLIANGSTLSLYANGQFLKSFTDTTYTTGQVAVYGDSGIGDFDIQVTDVKVWQI
ncbi:hypothetical protein [Tengunoibacter tsumagoiensis]|uniref:3-keto-disaccharide hydrolase domain-containing protein n=1 Tax=Tengunoibacter tsumagoiensis TaxID=2014871 RepID=A0A401ZXI3_9CHLR|nr:hypothetical protein [Tengunoibacter tsumagoiensis]GCE11564.1 hypothetical protein KTT_14230 [Tengunoibacter tsumagoiensis]